MPLINCKVKLKLKWTKHCVLFVLGTENIDANSNNVVFTTIDTKLYVHVVTSLEKENQKLLKLLSREFERSLYWNE